MEDKVKYTLKIIDGDGDTFAKRAEMYYRKRPEIVNFVEEAFRSYRALAERYDHLSTELQSANHMIATAFPEHVPFPLDDDDNDDDDDNNNPGDLKSSTRCSTAVRSGLSREAALEQINKLHKGILILQKDEFGVGEEIDDGEARTLVASTALSSAMERFEALRNKSDNSVAEVFSGQESSSEYEHIRGVEEDKAGIVSDSKDMEMRITALEEELSRVRDLDLQVVSEDAQEEDPHEDIDSVLKETEIEKEEDIKEAIGSSHDHGDQESVQEKSEIKDSSYLPETASTCFVPEAEDQGTKDENVETTTWRQLLPDAMEEREKVLFDEYTSVLKDYREVKKKLSEVEKKNRDGFFELALQLRELKNAVSCEDRDFNLLRQKMASKDSSYPVEKKQLDHESLTITPSSNPSISVALHHQGEDLNRTSGCKVTRGDTQHETGKQTSLQRTSSRS